jgi:chemotaxis protein histidine kinase CheA
MSSHSTISPSPSITASEAAAAADTIAHLQKCLDKATRDLNSERQRCEAAVSSSAQLQQRLDAALNMTNSASAMSFGFESLLPPSPPRQYVDVEALVSKAAAASPAPTLHAQLSEVSVSAADARAMASAAASTSAATSSSAVSTLKLVCNRAGSVTASCTRMTAGLSCVSGRLQEMKAQLQEQQLLLRVSQVTAVLFHLTQHTYNCAHTHSVPRFTIQDCCSLLIHCRLLLPCIHQLSHSSRL